MEEYSIKDVTRTFGLSRSSILYYEKLGIIHSKKNPENGYRVYTHDEINRLKECVSLKNIGYTVKEISEMFADQNRNQTKELHEHLAKIKHQIDIQKVYLEQMTHLKSLSECKIDQIDIVDAPEYLYLYSGCESGYHEINQSPESNLLIQNLPLSQFVVAYENFADVNSKATMGRCIESKNVDLLFENVNMIDWNKFGGCKYVRLFSNNVWNPFPADTVNRIHNYAINHQLKLSSRAYIVCIVPNLLNPMCEIYIPIE